MSGDLDVSIQILPILPNLSILLFLITSERLFVVVFGRELQKISLKKERKHEAETHGVLRRLPAEGKKKKKEVVGDLESKIMKGNVLCPNGRSHSPGNCLRELQAQFLTSSSFLLNLKTFQFLKSAI